MASLAGSAYSVADFEANAPELYKNLGVTERLLGEGGKMNVAMETLVVSKTTKNKEYIAKKEAANNDPLKMPAYDMKLEAMIPVIKKELPLK